VLCIHGFRQNAEGFKGKIGSFRKIFKNKNVEFVFLNAPHDVPPDPNINTEGKIDQTKVRMRARIIIICNSNI